MILFLGAGASRPFGIPTMLEMTSEIRKRFPQDDPFFREIEEKIKRHGIFPDLESILTVLVGLSTPSKLIQEHGPSMAYVVSSLDDRLKPSKINSTVHEDIEQIVVKIQNAIEEMCMVPEKTMEEKTAVYDALFNSLCEISRSNIQISPNSTRQVTKPVQFGSKIPYLPIDIFTTNYDLCIANYLRSRNIPFISSLLSKSIESHKVRLHQLHGAINLYSTSKGIEEFTVKPALTKTYDGRDIHSQLLIYPIYEKHIFEYPFLDMFESLDYSLKRAALCISIGYSFRDKAINDIFHNAVQTNPKLKVVSLCPDSHHIRDRLSFKRNFMPLDGNLEDPLMLPSLRRCATSWYVDKG